MKSDSDGEKSKLNHAPTIVNKNSKDSSSAGIIKNHHVLNANNILMANSPLPHACSQMGRRDLRGFQEFSTNRRPKILEKNPGMKSSEVAELLAFQWKALSKTEREIYERRAQHAVSLRQQKAEENSFTPDKNQNLKQQVLTESFTTTPSTPKSQRLSKEPPPLPLVGMVMEVSLELVENAVIKSASKSDQERKTKSGKIHLIGQLKPSGMWVYCKKNKIGILRHFALQEVVVCAKLMESLTIPLSPLPKPIEVNER
ncbi:hypothetical protein J437_LFUL011163 [Ladona fulva]|uniref:HMG box domain-containing protein n=1 Tax=Ladona fulva TaxID=123851 RepID=A0A8K0NZY4_LADFU|nr:hypothetical protein J437_LFUL011163 [Ladona fulva]